MAHADVTLTWPEYVALEERAVFAEDRLRIIRSVIGHKELPTGLSRIRWRLRALARIYVVLQRGTDPGESVQTLDTP